MQVKKVSLRLIIALLTFAIGVATTLLWVVPRFRSAPDPDSPKAAEAPMAAEKSPPEGWKELAIKNEISIQLPEDMKPAELIGDSYTYREAYHNQGIYIVISYGEFMPRRSQHDNPFNACDAPPAIQNDRTYHESLMDIEGRKAKFVIHDNNGRGSIVTSVCFPPNDKGVQLIVAAFCKDDPAAQVAREIFASIRFDDNKQNTAE